MPANHSVNQGIVTTVCCTTKLHGLQNLIMGHADRCKFSLIILNDVHSDRETVLDAVPGGLLFGVCKAVGPSAINGSTTIKMFKAKFFKEGALSKINF